MKTNYLKSTNQIPIVCLSLLLLVENMRAFEPEVIFSFPSQGTKPAAELVQGPDGSFYGTTSTGGSQDKGTVFRMTADGVVTTLVSFAVTNGATPLAGLTFGDDGALYGTTSSGLGGLPMVFKVTTNGVMTTLASFASPTNGISPKARLTRASSPIISG